jgi:hypothetical protein
MSTIVLTISTWQLKIIIQEMINIFDSKRLNPAVLTWKGFLGIALSSFSSISPDFRFTFPSHTAAKCPT